MTRSCVRLIEKEICLRFCRGVQLKSCVMLVESIETPVVE
jgi:hypothetical protein